MSVRSFFQRVLLTIPACALFAAACESDVTDRILELPELGFAEIRLFRDDNLNGVYNAGIDPPIIQGQVTLRRTSTSAASRTQFTDSAGTTRYAFTPPGRYTIDVGASVLGDSLLRVDVNREFTVVHRDTVSVNIPLRFPTVTVTEARELPVGRKAFVRGVVLNVTTLFGDSTVHMTDGNRSIRMSRVRVGGLENGDTVQMLGTRSARDGQPSYVFISVIDLGVTDPPLPTVVSTATAATADGGVLDAALVRINRAVIADTTTGPNGKLLTVNDDTGPLTVLLQSNIGFGQLNVFAPGVPVQVIGLLVPNPAQPGRWIVKPRARVEIPIVP